MSLTTSKGALIGAGYFAQFQAVFACYCSAEIGQVVTLI